jgi:hypothetical protein
MDKAPQADAYVTTTQTNILNSVDFILDGNFRGNISGGQR